MHFKLNFFVFVSSTFVVEIGAAGVTYIVTEACECGGGLGYSVGRIEQRTFEIIFKQNLNMILERNYFVEKYKSKIISNWK